MIRRGQIYLADLEPGFGTEPGKKRPVVVIQTNLINRVHTSTMVCPVTGRVRPGWNLLRVRVARGEGGVEKESDILVDQIRALDNRRLLQLLGQVPSDAMAQLSGKLKVLLDL